jgi:hypothetical protein
MNNEFTNRDPRGSTPVLHQPTPVNDLNPYLSPQVDWPQQSQTGQRANTVNDLATAALMMLLNLIGAAVMVPYLMAFASITPQSVQFPWVFWLVIQLVSCGFMALITIPIGVWLGSRVGLDAPVFRGIAKGDFSVFNPARAGWIAASVVGVAVGALVFLTDRVLPLEVTSGGLDQDTVKALASSPAWLKLLASFGTGITEETWSRFGFLAFIVWAGAALVGSERPSAAYFWVANILASLPFAAMYVFNSLALSGSIDPATVAYLVGFNSVMALSCGWLYWKYGIESAMAGRMIGDIAMRVVLPLNGNMIT